VLAGQKSTVEESVLVAVRAGVYRARVSSCACDHLFMASRKSREDEDELSQAVPEYLEHETNLEKWQSGKVRRIKNGVSC
jgi:hypothetical protein